MSFAFGVLIMVFVAAAVLRVPIAFAMIAAGLAYLFAGKQDIGLATDQILNTLYNSYVLLAIPMFDNGESLNAVVLLQRTKAAFDPEQIPDLVWRSNLFGRATSTLVAASIDQ